MRKYSRILGGAKEEVSGEPKRPPSMSEARKKSVPSSAGVDPAKTRAVEALLSGSRYNEWRTATAPRVIGTASYRLKSQLYMCHLCGVIAQSPNHLIGHQRGGRHKGNAKKRGFTRKGCFCCLLPKCQFFSNSPGSFEAHLRSSVHEKAALEGYKKTSNERAGPDSTTGSDSMNPVRRSSSTSSKRDKGW